WKDEEVNIILSIPKNTTVYFDNSIKRFLYHVNNGEDILDREMGNHHFIMTDETLKCTDCVIEKEIVRASSRDSISEK
ncbi:MAG: hypothetical protein ACWIPJ_11540, partial [Polaribacter sp.]